MGSDTVQSFAPGKLFIAGEYAVVTPGEPAVLIAVDRGITVTATPATGTGTIVSDQYPRARKWSFTSDGVLWHQTEPLDLVTVAIEVCYRFAIARAATPVPLDLSISSELRDQQGNKYGLGSSSAVTCAIIEAITRSWELPATREERFRLGCLVVLTLSPNASCADIAAATFGGWIAYTSFDRDRIMELYLEQGLQAALEANWEPGYVAPLTPPGSVQLTVGWTGRPAHTDTLVAALKPDSPVRTQFLSKSRQAVQRLIEGISRDDPLEILTAVESSQRALAFLDDHAGGQIETESLRRIRDSALQVGGVGKVSGAGGGDCGIVLSPAHTDVRRMLEEWQHHSITHLPLTVKSQEQPS